MIHIYIIIGYLYWWYVNVGAISTVSIYRSVKSMSRRCVTREEGEAFADKHGLLFMEMSARNAAEVEQAFIGTAEKVLNKYPMGTYVCVNYFTFSYRSFYVYVYGTDGHST